jgi:hypothetical protein
MSFTNFTQVSEAIALINAALAPSVYTKSAINIDEDSANANRQAIAAKEVNRKYEFYISTNVSGTWKWEKIGGGETTTDGSYVVVNTIDDRNELNTFEGLTAFVLETKSEHIFLNGSWVVDTITKEINYGEDINIIVGNKTKHKVVVVDYIISNTDGIETGVIKLTNINDNKLSHISSFDDLNLLITKEIIDDDLILNITNNGMLNSLFEAKLKWYYI